MTTWTPSTMGRKGGSKSRANLSPNRARELAVKAAKARWAGHVAKPRKAPVKSG